MKKNKTLLLVTVLVYLFLIGPLLVIAAASFSDTNYLKFPGAKKRATAERAMRLPQALPSAE